jgi:tetratricopeptide (TPR) repeat protein
MKWPFASKTSLTKLQLGNQRLAARDYAAAIELFLAHADEVPTDAATAFAKVAECYRRSNALPHPRVVAPGITLVSQGDLSSAEYYYRLALERDARHFSSLKGLAEVLPERSGERLRCMEQAVDVQPDTIMLTEIGDFYRRSDPTRAYGFYLKAQAHKPKDRTAYDRLQTVCRELGRNDEAQEWAKRWDAVHATKPRVDGRAGRG